jgi:hypothetical protein
MAEKKLIPEVAEKYELAPDTPISGGFCGFGPLDLSTLNLVQTESLIANGFTGLVAKKPKKEKAG